MKRKVMDIVFVVALVMTVFAGMANAQAINSLFTSNTDLDGIHTTESKPLKINGVYLQKPPELQIVQEPLKKTDEVMVNAVVLDSQGTDILDQTIWDELNDNWSSYGTVPVWIDYTTLNKEAITYEDIEATEADVLIVSCTGSLWGYTESEIEAIKSYIEEGHGIIITYQSFVQTTNKELAPLVGLDESIELGTNAFPYGISFDILEPDDPIFENVPNPYDTGVPYMTTPYPNPWPVTTGEIIANATAWTGMWKEGAIVKNYNLTQGHRGVYFSHYIEDQEDGSNIQDKQVFYNALIWTAGEVGEPTVTISTDEFEYSPGDTMTITIDITNPTEDSVTFQWYWGVPQYSIWHTMMSVPIPAGYDDTVEFSFTMPYLGSTPFGNVFCVQLLDASGEVLDADATCWAYSSGGEAMSAAKVNIANEIRKTIERIE